MQIILSLLLMFFTLTGFAYEKWYKVEVIVFENKDQNAFSENWPLNPGMPAIKNAIDLSQSNPEFIVLDNKQFMLNDTKRKLQNNYRIVLHQAWRQTLNDKAHAQNVHLIGGKQYPHSQGAQISADNTFNQYEVDGLIRFSGGKFLHLDSDLVFKKPVTILSGSEQTSVKVSEVLDRNWENHANARLQSFRLKESVRLKMGEVQYIDHPFYGVIVMVKPEKSEITGS